MRVKKLLLIITAACLSVVLSAGSALATPYWKDNNKMKGWEKPKVAKKVQFKDISGHWAEQNIVFINAENVIKGYTDNTFQPNKPVNKEEAITMIVRMASGDISDSQLLSGKYKNINNASSWARSYLNMAVNKGILSQVELNTIAFNKPAQRYEVAVWLVRAMGLEDEALESTGEDLDFKDEAAIPAWATGYVKVATDEGIISGYPGNVFKPGAPVTRAEMATMLVRVREGFDIPSPRQGFSFVRGVISEIDEDDSSITLKRVNGTRTAGTSVLTVNLADEALIYLDGKSAELEDLEEGDTVVVLMDSDKDAIVVIARSTGDSIDEDEDEDEDDNGTVDGVVESIGSLSITVKVDGKLKVYDLDEDVEVEIDGEEADLDDIKKGYEVELTLDDGEVTQIEAETETSYVTGVVESVGETRIKVKVNSVLKTYTLDEDVDVELDGKDADLDDIKKGYKIKLTIEDGEVTAIDADTVTVQVSGIVESVGRDTITVKVNGVLKVYALDDDVDVELDSDDADTDDLEKGYQVKLTIDGGKVIKIIANSGTISGVLESIGSSSITVKVDGAYKVYNLASGVDVIINNHDGDLEDLKKGADVKLTIANSKVVKIVAWVVGVNIR